MLRPLLSLVLIVVATAPASARVIRVSPGPGTPLQNAINGASPGDTIKLDEAVYAESVTITKKLRLLGARPTAPANLGSRLDAGCGATTALTVGADDVTVQGISVQGGTSSTIDVTNRSRVTLKDVVAYEGSVGGCGAVQDGIHVQGSRHVRILRPTVLGDNAGYGGSAGYRAAGIHLHGIPPAGDVRIKGLLPRAARIVVGNARGVLVEDCSGGIRLEKMGLTSNAAGISLHNSDGVLIQKNIVNDSRGSGTSVGIELDGNSDQNLIVKNTFVDAATDVMDGGTSNCWIGNTVGTGTVPTGGCDD